MNHLSATHGIRPLLFARGPNRRPIRVHDLRATFVTLALASGRSDVGRGSHRPPLEPNENGYRRAARAAAELNLGWLRPLDQVIPELRSSSANRLPPVRADPIAASPPPELPPCPRFATPRERIRAFSFQRRKAWIQVPPSRTKM